MGGWVRCSQFQFYEWFTSVLTCRLKYARVSVGSVAVLILFPFFFPSVDLLSDFTVLGLCLRETGTAERRLPRAQKRLQGRGLQVANGLANTITRGRY